MPYKVLVDELTVHQTVAKLPQPDGSTIYQNGLGQTYYRDEVIPDDEVAEDWREALESGEGALAESLSKVLEQSSDERWQQCCAGLGVPFAGYDDMEEDDVLNAMQALPSAAISRIKEYEGQRDEPRERIARLQHRITGSRRGPSGGARCQATCRTPMRTRQFASHQHTRSSRRWPGRARRGHHRHRRPADVLRIARGRGGGDPAGGHQGHLARRRRRGRRDRQPKPPEGPAEPSLERANE